MMIDSVIIYTRIQRLILCFKQKTAYEMCISDWSADVCSSDLMFAEESSFLRQAPGVQKPAALRDGRSWVHNRPPRRAGPARYAAYHCFRTAGAWLWVNIYVQWLQ